MWKNSASLRDTPQDQVVRGAFRRSAGEEQVSVKQKGNGN